MNVEQFVEWELAKETEVLGEYLQSATLCTTGHTWFYMGQKLGHYARKLATYNMSYDSALNMVKHSRILF
jgi:hypothetical protein